MSHGIPQIPLNPGERRSRREASGIDESYEVYEAHTG